MSRFSDDIRRIIDSLEHDDEGSLPISDGDSEPDEPEIHPEQMTLGDVQPEPAVEDEPEAEAAAPGDEAAEADEVDEVDAAADDDAVDADEPQPEPEDAPAQRPGFYLTPRQTFVGIAIALALLLIGLILYLLWLLMPADFTQEGGEQQAGIVPELALYGPGTGDQPNFSSPMGAAWSQDGKRIYVADTANNRIVAFDKKGKYLFQFGGFGIAKPLAGAARTWDPGELNYPTDVATDRKGNVYVADFYNDSISVFNKKGKFIRRFPDPYAPTGLGSSGQEARGIAVTAVTVTGDRVYATDEFQIFIFSLDGKLLGQFGKPGRGPGDIDHPAGLAVDSGDRILVADSNHNRIVAFTADGKPQWVAGRPITDANRETQNPFILPRGLTILPDGSVLVADPIGQQIIKLDENGKVIAKYGTRGAAEGQLNFPNDVDSYRERLVVADRENDRVQVVHLIGR